MDYRIEKDTMGEVQVPADKYWGAQTQRSKENFKIGDGRMPIEIVKAFGYLKKAAAATNMELGVLSEVKANLIMDVCDEIIDGKLDDQLGDGLAGVVLELEAEPVVGGICVVAGMKMSVVAQDRGVVQR